jgi:type I restriction enzyme, R subunit
MAVVSALAEKIREETAPDKADLRDVLNRIGEVLDRPIEGARGVAEGPPAIDLSRIDCRAQLSRLISLNETRVDLRQKFESLIEAYNAGSKQIEQLFLELVEFALTLTDEEQRHVREQLSEAELVVFDLLTRPGPELTTEERTEVKKVAKKLLERLKTIATLDWRMTSQARARVRQAIEDALDEGLPKGLLDRCLQDQGRGRLPAHLRTLREGSMNAFSRQCQRSVVHVKGDGLG